MEYKYYDLLSCLTVGISVFCVTVFLLFPEAGIPEITYVPLGYLTGYFLNAISSILEHFFYWTIGGKPSDNLLSAKVDHSWTGCRKVKFFFANEVVEYLRKDTQDENATKEKMFAYAMQQVNSSPNSRISDFNGHYALSRVVLTATLIVVIVVEIKFCCICWSWPLSITALLLTWNRFKERGYYYAREVLNEYLKTKTAKEDGNHKI